jgi:predicted amidohydrolase
MRVAAYQAPFLSTGSVEVLGRIRKRIAWCEAERVKILCCPEAILGGLADYADDAPAIAIDVEGGELEAVLAPLASDTVTTILGFTERTGAGALYNSAAIFHKGSVLAVCRKLHPAINRSIYEAGKELQIYDVDGFTFGILICNDSNYPEAARSLVSRGAMALFIPTNNALPARKADVVAQSRGVDIALARQNRVSVIRADVAGRADGMVSYGSSGIIDSRGIVLQAGRRLCEDLLLADVERSAVTR